MKFKRHDIRVHARRLIGAVCVSALLTGCISPSGGRLPPAVAVPSQWLAASDRAAAPAARRWWVAFEDATLTELIDEALATNNDLAIAAIRVHRARLRAGLIAMPSAEANAGINVSREFDSAGTRRVVYVNASLSYEADLWGKLAAQRSEAAWKARASAADREAAALALIGTTAKLYWQIGNLNELLARGEASIADAERMVELAKARHRAGAASALDVAEAEQQAAQQRAEQSGLRMEREAKRNALAVLFDRAPEQRAAEPIDLSTATLPAVGAGLPSEVLARRPDLRAAESRLRASLANIDVARASFYPRFALTGEFGTSSEALVRTLQSPVAALGIGLTLPFVQWKTKQLELRVARSEYDEAVADFRQKLHRALADVEDALSARTQLDAQAVERERAVVEAQRAAMLAETRFRAGKTSLAPWIEAQRALRHSMTASTTNRLTRLENRMDLYLALGGGEG
ncbi:efflux transporter outer membrane subunit [Trinickia sp. EG282A]|uniref:efflux transporter outer membrane subunit n=1 Tax=Trinickia sp. EG282A TaxID=3237013 RepID=UPI0034D1E6EB